MPAPAPAPAPALDIGDDLARRNPANVDYQLLHIELLGQRPSMAQAALEHLTFLRDNYGLDSEHLNRANAIQGDLDAKIAAAVRA